MGFGLGVVSVGYVVWVKTDGIWSKSMVKCHGQNPWLEVGQTVRLSLVKSGGLVGW